MDFVAQQKKASSSSSSSSSSQTNKGGGKAMMQDEQEFVQHQKRVFDEMAETFATGETIPDNLIPIYQYLGQQIILHNNDTTTKLATTAATENNDSTTTTRILDVACGTGNLWPFLKRQNMHIVGVDVSPQMVHAAQQLHKSNASIVSVVEADIMEYRDEQQEPLFDIVIANACFGNFWNQTSFLNKVQDEFLKLGGILIVSHPLGAQFVERLHQEDATTVPYLLPTSTQLWTNDLLLTLPYTLMDFQHPTITINGEDVPFYLAKLQKVRARVLGDIQRWRGIVDTGYGRGGKKLGFPTANLPSSLFQNALQDVDTGVYFGWVGLRNEIHKAVVNVGFSPTFEGQENVEKIIEAHLIVDDALTDFYGEPMRLQLVGKLRPEIKFPSFPDLIQQIHQDVADAKAALDEEPYICFGKDPFLVESRTEDWVGKNGGDAEASWEFEDSRAALEKLD